MFSILSSGPWLTLEAFDGSQWDSKEVSFPQKRISADR